MRRCHQDRTRLGAPRPVKGHHHHRPRGGNRSGNPGKSGRRRFHASRPHLDSAAILPLNRGIARQEQKSQRLATRENPAGTSPHRWPLTTRHCLFHSAIFATCTSKPVLGSSDVSENALKPSPLISV